MGTRELRMATLKRALSWACLALIASFQLLSMRCPYVSADGDHSSHSSGPTPSSSAISLSSSVCVTTPSDAACKTYTYPDADARADLDKLCTSMPFMIGCSLRSLCDAKSIVSEKYCAPISLLQTICIEDTGMSSMQGCANVSSLCGSGGSVVEQCKQKPPIPSVIESFSTTKLAVKSCSQMNMDGCDLCVSENNCKDPLMAMSRLCQSMWMDECQEWKSMCDALADNERQSLAVICGSSSPSEATPLMRMYFHTGLVDYVLFKGWVPRTPGYYTLTVLAILLLGILSTLLRLFRKNAEMKFAMKDAKDPTEVHSPADRGEAGVVIVNGIKRKVLSRKTILLQNAVRGAFMAAIVTVDYMLMLIAMTFNVGLFIAVVVGFSLGQLLFGHLLVEERVGSPGVADPMCCG